MNVGFKALEERYSLRLAQPLRIESSVGTLRSRQEFPTEIREQYPPRYAPSDDLPGHLEFGINHEELHLEFLSRLFQACGPHPIEEWCLRERYGKAARRAGFLYEWLTGKHLDVPDLENGGYIDAVPKDRYLTRTRAARNRRWRVNDNLPGTPAFCPVVRRTAALQEALTFSPSEALRSLDKRFGGDILLRSAGWLTMKESRASFLIEHEEDRSDRIRRFADAMSRHCGKLERPLSPSALRILQASILGRDALGLGIRQSPVFVGQTTLTDEIVHYVAPPSEHLSELLAALEEVEICTRGAESLLRAAVLSFAFVYLHPLRDGNGRIHRFLLNDILLRDGILADGAILPLSASIADSAEWRMRYEKTLETFSRPFMDRYGEACRFGETFRATDGTLTNFSFEADDEALPAWRYPDLTAHALFTAYLVRHTLSEMAEEVQLLQRFQVATRRIKEIVEMPDTDATRIIRSLRENAGRVSGKLVGEYPCLEDAALATRMAKTVREAFEEISP